MREPDFQTDGWCLDDGESYHAAAPETFWIPDRQTRESLEPGDLAKLIFRISVDDGDENVAVERMWVLVRERRDGGYLGMLDNEPSAIAKNDEFWLGTELPFSARHVINIEEKDEKTVALARQKPLRRWPTQ
jgi:uncharacterized protein YegJ (DUF2314 family)